MNLLLKEKYDGRGHVEGKKPNVLYIPKTWKPMVNNEKVWKWKTLDNDCEYIDTGI